MGWEEVNKGRPVDNLDGIYGDNMKGMIGDETISACAWRYHKSEHLTGRDGYSKT